MVKQEAFNHLGVCIALRAVLTTGFVPAVAFKSSFALHGGYKA